VGACGLTGGGGCPTHPGWFFGQGVVLLFFPHWFTTAGGLPPLRRSFRLRTTGRGAG